MNNRITNCVRLHRGIGTILKALVAAVICLSTVALSGADKDKKKAEWDPAKLPPAAKQEGITYEKDIKPILEKSCVRSEEHTLNSSHTVISYAVFCLKKKKTN